MRPSGSSARTPTQRPASTSRSTAKQPLADLDRVERAHRGDQRPLDLGAGGVAAGVHDAGDRVPTLPGEREHAAVAVAGPVEHRAQRDELADPVGAFGDEHPHRVRVAEPGAGGERVGEVQLGRVGRLERGGDATLRVPGGRLRELALGEHDHRPARVAAAWIAADRPAMPLPEHEQVGSCASRLRNRRGVALTRRDAEVDVDLGAVDGSTTLSIGGPGRPRPRRATTTSPSSSVDAARGRARPRTSAYSSATERLGPPRSRAPSARARRRRARRATTASPRPRSAGDSTRAAAPLLVGRGRRCGSTSRRRRARGRAGSRRRRPGGRDRRPSAGPPRAAGSPCARSTRGTARRSRTASATTVVTPSKCAGRPRRTAPR